MNALKISDEGLALIRRFEGFRPIVYKDAAGLATIGYGHKLIAEDYATQRFRAPISAAGAEALLREDVRRFEAAINRLVKVPLEQHQFDALVSWVYNVGIGAFEGSTLILVLNQGRYSDVGHEILKWNKRKDPATGHLVVDRGLCRRRLIEAQMWGG